MDDERPGARRGGLASPVTLAVLGAAVLVLLGTTVALSILIHKASVLDLGTGLPIPLVYATVGVIVARHQPRNPIGWILILFVLLFLIWIDAGFYAVFCYRLGHRGLPLGPAAVVLASSWPLPIALFPLTILLFPDGRLSSRRWRPILIGYAVAVCYALIANLVPPLAAVTGHHIQVDANGYATSTSHLPAPLTAAVYLVAGLIWLSFVGHQVASWRHATGERRQQLKWLACGAAVAICLGPLGNAFGSAAASQLVEVGTTAIPIGIGVGILKYRLYDIDRIISRTLAYAIVTGILVGVYAGLVLLATGVLGLHSTVAVAAATLAAAALFAPVRRRVQQAVDRRFNRARYDADRTIAAFAGRLQDAVDIDTVRDDLARVVQGALEPAHLTVWITPGR